MMRRKLLKKRTQKREMTDISLTPLIDAVLTLLVIFMVAAPTVHHAIKVQLPHAKSGKKEAVDQNNELIVYLDKDNQLFFNGTRVEQEALVAQLKKIATEDMQTVFVRADQAVSYGKVVELVDTIKLSGGIQYVALAIQQSA